MTKTRSNLLKSLLIPLVDEWGIKEVRHALDSIMEDIDSAGARQLEKSTSGSKNRESVKKPTAVEIVRRMDLAPETRSLLEQLAARYDSKRFLASAADIRRFFEDKGRIPPVVKHRSDAFRKVVTILLELSPESQKSLLSSHTYAGPSQLGPLSSAIRQRGATIREEPLGVSKDSSSNEENNIPPSS